MADEDAPNDPQPDHDPGWDDPAPREPVEKGKKPHKK